MNKKKDFLVISILAVYFSLIGANLIWQHGEQLAGSALSAEIVAATPIVKTPEQKAADDKAANANSLAKNAAADAAAKQSARNAQEALQKSSQTDGAKEAELQKNANKIALYQQNPSALVNKPAMPPTYMKPILEAEKAKKIADTLALAQQQNDAATARKQNDIKVMQAQLQYSKDNNVPISPQLANKFETTKSDAYNDCIANATALSDRDAAQKAATESAADANTAGITTTTDPDTGLKTEIVGTETADPVVELTGEQKTQLAADKTAQAVADETARQEAIKAQCASLSPDSPTNDVAAGSKNYAALEANLSNLSAAIDTSANAQKTASQAAVATASGAVDSIREDASAAKLAATEQAVGAQKKSNAESAMKTEKPKTPIVAIGLSNLKSDGTTHVYNYCETDAAGNCLKNDDGTDKLLDVIPIYPDKYDDSLGDQEAKYLVPSWNYNTNVTTAGDSGLTVYGTGPDGIQIPNPSINTLGKITSGTGSVAGSSGGSSSGGSSSGGSSSGGSSSGGSSSGGSSSGGSSSGGDTDDIATAKSITKTGHTSDGTAVTLSVKDITIRDAGICLEYKATCQNDLNSTTATGAENSSPTLAAENCLDALSTTLNLTGTSGSSSSGGSSSGGSSSGGSSSGGSSSGGSSSGGTGGDNIYTDAEIIEMRKEHFNGGIYHDMDFSFEIPTAKSKTRTLTDAGGKIVTLTVTSVSSNHCGSYLANCTNGSKSVTSPAENYPLDAAYSCLDKLAAELGLS